ncbi:MAG: ABC transporter ATP-binding protein [Oscillospiraceae bacterium]|nr:ABC transporter ATP-binding protein [Oscillospiraceae bacterium]
MRLAVENLSFSYGAAEVLHDISFFLEAGEFVSVLGPNGVGKSTLFRCILGSLPDYEGIITVDGRDVRALSRRERAKAVAYIPQIHRPTFGYSVLDTVLMGLSRQVRAFSQPKKEHIALAEDALRRVGAEHLKERDFSRLSGGEQQLVLIARAIAQQSHILVMDEPTSSLDYGNQFRILDLIRKLADEGYGVLLSTHDPQHALRYADTLLALHEGRIAAHGVPADLLDAALIRRLYGVEAELVPSSAGPVIVPKRAGK